MPSHANSRIALITADTTGVGHATARLVHSQGNSVLITPCWETITGRVAHVRFGESDDVAGAVAFPALPAADFITGHTLAMDGGLSAA